MNQKEFDKKVKQQRRWDKKQRESQLKYSKKKPTGKRKYKKKTNRQKLIKKLDNLWSLKIREPRKCELCGKKGDIKNFDAHHIRGRGNMSTRWDLDNGACLCKGCHRFKIHMDTMTSSILIDKLKKKRGKDWFPKLVKKSNKIVKHSIQDLKDIKDKFNKDQRDLC